MFTKKHVDTAIEQSVDIIIYTYIDYAECGTKLHGLLTARVISERWRIPLPEDKDKVHNDLLDAIGKTGNVNRTVGNNGPALVTRETLKILRVIRAPHLGSLVPSS
jgi:hypothetical protein